LHFRSNGGGWKYGVLLRFVKYIFDVHTPRFKNRQNAISIAGFFHTRMEISMVELGGFSGRYNVLITCSQK
jgi:hypothetical protein